MRVLQVITPSKIAGAERSTASLCEHLVRAGHAVTVACKAGHPFVEFLQGVGIDTRPLAIGGKANLAAPVRVARLAREVRAEVIHTQHSTAALWGSVAGMLAGIPVVAHVRALNRRNCYLLADRVIAISRAVKEHLVGQGMEGERIDVVYSGVDAERYGATMDRAAARALLSLPLEARVVAVLAHLTEKKGHHVFLEAWAAVARRVPAALALFAGDGEERQGLEAQAARLGLSDRVRFLGYREDVLPLYAAADAVALPSVAGEGLPRTLLEAGFLGLPAVGTRLSGIPEIVREGETGFVVQPDDPGALADRLARLLADAELRERLGRKAQRFVGRTFTVEAMVAGTVAAYRRAGAGRGGSVKLAVQS